MISWGVAKLNKKWSLGIAARLTCPPLLLAEGNPTLTAPNFCHFCFYFNRSCVHRRWEMRGGSSSEAVRLIDLPHLELYYVYYRCTCSQCSSRENKRVDRWVCWGGDEEEEHHLHKRVAAPKPPKVRWELSKPWTSAFRGMVFPTCKVAIRRHVSVCVLHLRHRLVLRTWLEGAAVAAVCQTSVRLSPSLSPSAASTWNSFHATVGDSHAAKMSLLCMKNVRTVHTPPAPAHAHLGSGATHWERCSQRCRFIHDCPRRAEGAPPLCPWSDQPAAHLPFVPFYRTFCLHHLKLQIAWKFPLHPDDLLLDGPFCCFWFWV